MVFRGPFWSPSDASAILFDWDGVIADTRLDFSEVKRKYYGDRPAMLLEDSVSLASEARESLMRDLEEIETRGARNASFVRGVDRVLGWVEDMKIQWAIVSRNCKKSILISASVMGMKLPSIVRSRDDGDCVKPDPRALREVCGHLSAAPSQALLIGDYIYDMMGARRAGMRGILVRDKIQDGWAPWLELCCANMDELFAWFSSPSDFVPWEYQETALKYGRGFLRTAYEIFLDISDCFPAGTDSTMARAASLGVGGFVVGRGVFSPEMWKLNPGFDPASMGMSMADAARSFLSGRWPFASVAETAPGGTRTLRAPLGADEIPEFIMRERTREKWRAR